jgi:hypothetical protein
MIITLLSVFLVALPPGCGGGAPSLPIATKMSFSEPPVLGKPVEVTFTFGMEESYQDDAKDATATIRLPAEGFEVISSNLKQREEVITDYAYNQIPDTRYIVLEWQGDIIQHQTHTLQATVKAISGGYYTIEGRVTAPHVTFGGADNIYVSTYEDSAEISEGPLPHPPDGVPMYDVSDPDKPPTIIPFDRGFGCSKR